MSGALSALTKVNSTKGSRYFSADGTATASTSAKVAFKTDAAITADVTTGAQTITMLKENKSKGYSFDGSKVNWTVNGTGNDDYLLAVSGNVTLNGGNGNDTLVAGVKGGKSVTEVGDVVLNGGAGADSLVVSSYLTKGSVTLTGGSGNDVFDLRSVESGVNVTITDYSQGDTIIGGTTLGKISGEAAILDYAEQIISADGTVSLATGATVQIKPTSDGFYRFTDGSGNTVYAGAETGTTVDAAAETKAVFVTGSNNGDTADVLRGGKGADTLVTGEGDSVLGGKGNDSIYVGEKDNVYVGFNDVSNAGTDEVFGAKLGTGEGATTFYLANSTLGASGFGGAAFGNNTVTLKGGNGNLVIHSTDIGNSTQVELLMQDSTGTYKTEFFSGTAELSDKTDDVYYGVGKNAAIDFSESQSDLVIDLSNSKALGDSATYYNVANVKAGTGDSVVMVGSTKAATTLQAGGGNTSLWGGSKDNDSLVGGHGKDFFALSNAGGADKVSGFTAGAESYSDAVYLLGNVKLTNVSKSSTGVAFTLSDGSSLTLQSNDSLTDDMKIGFTTDGENVSYGKVGRSGQASNFTYSGDVGAYVGGKAGSTITVAESQATTVWLDGAAGVGYSNISKVDGSGSTGSLTIGGTASKDSLVGGSGSNTLWGGAGNDTLTGGTGYNEFFMGSAEGSDVITGSKAEDKVMLYNMSLNNVATATVKNGNLVLGFNNGSQLTVNSYQSGAATYEFTDGVVTLENGDWVVSAK